MCRGSHGVSCILPYAYAHVCSPSTCISTPSAFLFFSNSILVVIIINKRSAAYRMTAFHRRSQSVKTKWNLFVADAFFCHSLLIILHRNTFTATRDSFFSLITFLSNFPGCVFSALIAKEDSLYGIEYFKYFAVLKLNHKPKLLRNRKSQIIPFSCQLYRSSSNGKTQGQK